MNLSLQTDAVRVNRTRDLVRAAKDAFYKVSVLPLDIRNRALEALAAGIEADRDEWLAANLKDQDDSAGKLAASLFARLKLDKPKIRDVVQGVRDIAALPDPVGTPVGPDQARRRPDTGQGDRSAWRHRDGVRIAARRVAADRVAGFEERECRGAEGGGVKRSPPTMRS